MAQSTEKATSLGKGMWSAQPQQKTLMCTAQCFCFQNDINYFFGYFHPEKTLLDNENK